MFVRTGEKFLGSFYIIRPVRAKVIRGARTGELVDVVAVSGSEKTCVAMINSSGGMKWPRFPKQVVGIDTGVLSFLSNSCPMR